MQQRIDLEQLCADKGLRITEQRRVIARVLSESDDHPDVELVVNLTIPASHMDVSSAAIASGKSAALPAPPEAITGIVTASRTAPCVPADCDLVVETRRGTTLEKDGARVHTTEHLLAALDVLAELIHTADRLG